MNPFGDTASSKNPFGDAPSGKNPFGDSAPKRALPFEDSRQLGGEIREFDLSLHDIIQPLREFAHGASLGVSDDLEALLKQATGGETWSQEYDSIQEERDAFGEENPWTKIGLEVLGGLTTGGFLARGLGIGGNLASAVARQGTAGAIEAGTYGFFNEKELPERLEAAGRAAMLGGLIGSGGGVLANALRPMSTGQKSERLLKELRKEVQKIPEGEQYSLLEQAMYQKALNYKTRGLKDGNVMPNPRKLAADTAEELGLDANKMLKYSRKHGGIPDFRQMSGREMAFGAQGQPGAKGQLRRTPAEAARVAARSGTGVKAQFDSLFSPIKRMMYNQVGKRFAHSMNRAQNRALMQQAKFHDEYGQGIQDLRLFLDDNTLKESLWLKERLLNGALGEAEDFADARSFIKQKFGKDTLKAFDAYMDQVEKWAFRYQQAINSESPVTKGWLHTQLIHQRGTGLKPATSPNVKVDVAEKMRFRKVLDDQWEVVQQYDNPLRTMDDWIDDHAAAINTAEILNLRPAYRTDLAEIKWDPKRGPADLEKKINAFRRADEDAFTKGIRGGYIGRALREKLAKEGYADQQIDDAVELTHSLLFDAQRAPSAIVRSLRDLGYSGTIFNMYGAALNIHDVFNASTTMGIRNAFSTILRKAEIPAEEVGIASQYMGEYVKRLGTLSPTALEKALSWTKPLAEKSARWSGFKSLDKWGKERILSMSLNEARKAVRSGNFDNQWKYTFTPAERMQLKSDLAKGEVTDLVKELAMFRLSDIQPINAAQQTKFSLNHPNARMLYMLKNFAIRQFDFLRTNVVDKWKAGDKLGAANFAVKYALYSGGGFALVNEARQPLAGREADFSPEQLTKSGFRQLASVMMMGIPSASDYGWEKFWDDPPRAFAEGIVPPLNIMTSLWDGTLGGEPEELLKNLPVVGKTFFTPILEADEDD